MKSFLGNFYSHLAIFIWSHWWYHTQLWTLVRCALGGEFVPPWGQKLFWAKHNIYRSTYRKEFFILLFVDDLYNFCIAWKCWERQGNKNKIKSWSYPGFDPRLILKSFFWWKNERNASKRAKDWSWEKEILSRNKIL